MRNGKHYGRPAEKLPQEKGYIAYRNYDSNDCATEAYCETCSKEFQEVEKTHSGNVFVVLIILSIAILVAGIMLKWKRYPSDFQWPESWAWSYHQ